MARETILYISDPAAVSDPILAALKTTSYEVVSTDSSTQAIALLFIMHSVAGIVLRDRAAQQTSFDVARSLRALRPDVPIVLLCGDRIDRLPTYVDAWVNTAQPIEKLTSEVQHSLTAERFPEHRHQLCPQRDASAGN
jgi:DNA-binding NtrC family response regulator